MGCEHLGKELRIKHLGKVETIPFFHLPETNIFWAHPDKTIRKELLSELN